MIVWLASYPRSGNTFCRIALHRLFGHQSYSSHNLEGSATAKQNLFGCNCFTDRSLAELDEDESLHIVKTHHIGERFNRPGIYLIRDGRDALVSYAHFERFARREDPAREDFSAILRNLILEDRSPFGRWGENVSHWEQRPGIQMVRFEEFIRNPGEVLTETMGKLGLPRKSSPEPLPTFEELHGIRPDFFRKGTVSQWRDQFPEDLLALFYELNGEVLRKHGYTD